MMVASDKFNNVINFTTGLDHETERRCADCYGLAWPGIRAALARMESSALALKQLASKGLTMTNLETVAAQRDELSMKNRELAQQLEAANAEIARLNGEFEAARGFARNTQVPPLRNPSAAAPSMADGGYVDGGYVEPRKDDTPGALLLRPGEKFVPAPVHGGDPGEVPPAPTPKPKRSRFFGGEKP